jgi:hypothetical protein
MEDNAVLGQILRNPEEPIFGIASFHPSILLVPSVFGRNLQCQPVKRVNTREKCHWSHACSLQANMRGIQWHPRV